MSGPARAGRHRGLALTIVAAVGAMLVLIGLPMSSASFSDTTDNAGNSMASDLLDPPTALVATGGGDVTLDWTATVDTYAAGHRVLRSATSGGPYTQIAEITPRTMVTYVDSPADGTYYYVARAYTTGWESVDSNEVVATVSTATLAGSWQTGLTHTAGAGANRALVFVASNEEQSIPSPTLTGVTYGGQALTLVIADQVASGGIEVRIEVWMLDEAGLAAASSSTIVPSWTAAPDTPLYSHAVFANIDQTSPIGDTTTGSTIGDIDLVPLSPVTTANHDMVVGFAAAGEAGTYTAENGFTLGVTQSTTTGGTTAQGTSHKSATGADETVAMRFLPAAPPWINRQVAGAIVLNVVS